MKHTTSRMLFAHWDALRGERAAPERQDLKPGGLRHVLADTFVLALEGPRGPAFRLAGTRIGALFGRDLRHQPFATLWPPEERLEAGRLVDVVAGDQLGAVAGLLGENENGSELPLELLLLPLRHRGRTDSRVLGALSPASIPSWAGLVPLARLTIRSVRMIEPARRGLDDRSGAKIPLRRALFVVHEGGRP